MAARTADSQTGAPICRSPKADFDPASCRGLIYTDQSLNSKLCGHDCPRISQVAGFTHGKQKFGFAWHRRPSIVCLCYIETIGVFAQTKINSRRWSFLRLLKLQQSTRPLSWNAREFLPATDAPSDRKFDEHIVLHGIDNVFNGMILVPAILLGAGYDVALPTHYIANHFYLLEGKKFSTSRNHAIWADDFVEKHGSDATRIYLCKTAPEYSQTNFSSSEFAAFCANDLAGRWGSWWQFVLDDCLPGRKRGRRPGPDWQHFYTAMAALRRHLSPYDFSVSRAFVVLDDMVSVALRRSPDKAGQIAALHAFAVCLWPIAPSIAESILSALGHPNPTAPSWPTTERSMAVLKVPSAPAHEKINNQIAKWKSIRSA